MRIYHFHVRKTAGTSLNSAFWGLAGLDLEAFGQRIEIERRGMRFVKHNRRLIEAGNYFFASSHEPFHSLAVPQDTFKVTILRDPAARLLSYLRYLLWARNATSGDPWLDRVRHESRVLDGGPWSVLARYSPRQLRCDRRVLRSGYGTSLRERLELQRARPDLRRLLGRMSPNHVYAQLHMFSSRYDPHEAAENVLTCDAVLFTESYSEDLERLAGNLGLDLRQRRERSFGDSIALSAQEQELLRRRLRPEYEMLELVRAQLRSDERSSGVGRPWVPD